MIFLEPEITSTTDDLASRIFPDSSRTSDPGLRTDTLGIKDNRSRGALRLGQKALQLCVKPFHLLDSSSDVLVRVKQAPDFLGRELLCHDIQFQQDIC